MKIETLLTIILTPDQPGEDLKAIYEQFRADLEKEAAGSGGIKIPANTKVRWLLKGGLLPDV